MGIKSQILQGAKSTWTLNWNVSVTGPHGISGKVKTLLALLSLVGLVKKLW